MAKQMISHISMAIAAIWQVRERKKLTSRFDRILSQKEMKLSI